GSGWFFPFRGVFKMAAHKSLNEPYATLAYYMRVVQLVALLLQIAILYSESDRLGISFLFPVTMHALNIYHTGYRWYYHIDGRYDFKQLLSSNDFGYKLPYMLAVLGSFLLAIVGHFMLRIEGLYLICSYISIATSGVVLINEAFAAIISKLM
uniref:DUF7087 domain-containing protein n=1 Tax=Parascaris univalens TaxID=6257 RepID=A0A915ABA5_PARUN